MIEKIIEEESRKDKYATCSDEDVTCSCGNTLFFKVSYPVVPSLKTSTIPSIHRHIEYTYECLFCGKEQVQIFLSKKVYAAIDLLSKYDVDRLNDYDYLEAIKELEEYLC